MDGLIQVVNHQGIRNTQTQCKARMETQKRESQELTEQHNIRNDRPDTLGRIQWKNLRKYPATLGIKGITTGRANHASIPKVAPRRQGR